MDVGKRKGQKEPRYHAGTDNHGMALDQLGFAESLEGVETRRQQKTKAVRFHQPVCQRTDNVQGEQEGNGSKEEKYFHCVELRLDQDTENPNLSIYLPIQHFVEPTNLMHSLFSNAARGVGQYTLEDLMTYGRTITLSQESAIQAKQHSASQTKSQFETQSSISKIIQEYTYNKNKDTSKALRRQVFKKKGKGYTCTICQLDLLEKQKCITTKCEHYFHEKCLTRWLKMKLACPNCKEPIK